ncbi:putative CoA-binding protein [Bradyrhizobium sp. LM3.2]
MNHDSYPDNYIRGILNGVKSIAMVGASPVNVRPSYFAFKYLAQRGYDMIPVNPGHVGKELLGKPFVASLSDIGRPIDMIDIFRNSSHIMPVVEEALTLDPLPTVIWMQLGARDDAAALKAESVGIKVVMNRCPKIEYGRSVLGDLLDGRQFAHAEFQAPPGADAGYALIPQSDECRRRRDRGIGSRRQKQDRAKLTQLRRVHFANATMRSTIILM